MLVDMRFHRGVGNTDCSRGQHIADRRPISSQVHFPTHNYCIPLHRLLEGRLRVMQSRSKLKAEVARNKDQSGRAPRMCGGDLTGPAPFP